MKIRDIEMSLVDTTLFTESWNVAFRLKNKEVFLKI